MSYIKFESLDDLMAYLRACEANETCLGGETDLYTKVYLSSWRPPAANGRESTLYAIYVPPDYEAKVAADFLHGGTLETGPTPGDPEGLGRLLRRLPLRARRDPPRHIPALVVAARVATGADLQALQQRLHQAWRGIPRQQHAASTFYKLTEGGQTCWLVVHVEGVEPWFSGKQWCSDHEASGLLLLTPPDACEELRSLFVQWNYEYPKPQEFYLLDDVNRDTDALLLCTAGAALQPGAAATRGDALWYTSEWHVITERQGSRSDEIWGTEGKPLPTVSDLAGQALAELSVDLPMAVGVTYKAVGATSQLEQRISAKEHELEDLHARHSRLLHASRRREFVPIYTFCLDDDDRRATSGLSAPDPLPRKLEHFLRRPLGELDQYEYVRGSADGKDIHYVIGTIAVAPGAALAVPCTEAYLQDQRWLDWGLPLFVRSDCSLVPDIEEQDMAEKLGGVLRDARVRDGARAVLAKPSAQGVHDAPTTGAIRAPADTQEVDGLQTLDLLGLPEGVRLTEGLSYINDHGDGPAAIAIAAQQSLEATFAVQRIAVPEWLSVAQRALHEYSNERVTTAEEKWEALRKSVREVQFDTAFVNLVLEVTREAYGAVPQSWGEFVRRVCAINELLAAQKLVAWGEWTGSELDRAERLATLDVALLEVGPEIAAKTQELEALLAKVDLEQAAVVPKIQALAKLRDELQRKHAALLKLVQELEEQIAAAEADKAKLEAATADVVKKTDELNKKRLQVEAERQRLDAEKTAHQKASIELQKSKLELDKSGQDLQKERETKVAAVYALDSAIGKARDLANHHRPRVAPPPPPPSLMERLLGRRKK